MYKLPRVQFTISHFYRVRLMSGRTIVGPVVREGAQGIARHPKKSLCVQ